MLKQRAKASKALRPQRMEYGSRESRVTGSWASPPPPSPSAGEAAASGERPRSALKIRLDILEGVRDNGPSRSSRIICMANLSGRAYPEYLRELVSLGLLSEERDGDANSYTLTAKGLDFVNRVKEAQAFAAALGLTM
jgi:predicted transcriptional regulator